MKLTLLSISTTTILLLTGCRGIHPSTPDIYPYEPHTKVTEASEPVIFKTKSGKYLVPTSKSGHYEEYLGHKPKPVIIEKVVEKEIIKKVFIEKPIIVEIPVEKIVEKRVEVPVEKIVEKRVEVIKKVPSKCVPLPKNPHYYYRHIKYNKVGVDINANYPIVVEKKCNILDVNNNKIGQEPIKKVLPAKRKDANFYYMENGDKISKECVKEIKK